MKIAITSQGKNLTDPMDPRFGRAPYFIIYDTVSGAYEAIDNTQNMNTPQGAGIQAGQNVVNTGAQALITGNVGPKAFQTLQAGGINMFLCGEMSVHEAVEKYKAGDLQPCGGANVQGHWM
ncbi:dinitrogenase iron-molybdenum cofactor biosynthesis protein [bacterium]|nr:dinitrogenase iron-molybdenum cofactor biosynthesis protein [bacterium]